ncbi:disks large-associated protein 3 isoform X1 [Danio rerio]|uniref:Discs, large (Drosophila) homolog-associated protein 3 n=3 Tax=Danio rerio TaxID=7955 RepID=A0A8M2B6G8_DANRE|nr:disks large-associated protein 3 [Danio rerio]XP_005159736.1 disks large-associated protein 3 isoform X1 [Danio rerio]|eukprot:NP_001038179.1 disks large-associated protein 3 [Danio rerio]
MKGYQVSRSLSQHSSGPCYCMPEDCDTARDYMHHPDHYQGHNDHHYYPPGGPPEPLAMVPSGGGTFPRSHPSQPQHFDSTCEECLSSAGHGHGHGGKMHRIPPNLLDQFEKQLPFHPDGFHTLQYQRTASGEQRSESPSRIRHLVNSVQRLFAKSHSLEAPSKREFNGTRGGEYRERERGHRSGGEESGGHHYSGTHQSRSARRNKSRERSKSGDSRHESRSSRHRSKTAGWWSSDDNLDSDSSFLVGAGRGVRGYPTGHETLDAAIQELTLRKSKGPPPGECLACTNIAMTGDSGHSLKRSTWSSMTVSQAREVYPSSRGGGGGPGGGGGGYEKALVPLDPKMKERSLHHLQVPSDDWCGGGPSDSGGEIPCRRMRSGSYIKAMGDDDSVDSDTSPKASPKSALIAQREAFRRSVSMDQRSSTTSKYSCKQCTDAYPNSRTTPKGHARSRSYTRSLTSAQLGDTLNLFGEMESQAVEALDLPGCFRTRSHSYVRAIQAGCSQDDDCLSVFSMSVPQASMKGEAVFPYRKGPPPLPPRMSKPMISVTAQSSTESTQDAYFQSTGQPALVRPRQHSNSVDLTENSGGRTSRGGHYLGGGTARVRQSSNSAESLNGRALQSIAYHSGPGPMKPKHSSSADNLLEGPRGSRDRVGGSLGKSASLPQNSMSLAKALTVGEEFKQEGRGRKWRPSIAVQVDSSETLSDSDPEGKALREVHSIGVQVEDDKRRARFKRSNSVTASVQADLETEGFGGLTVPTQDKGLQFGCSFQRHSSEPESASQFAEYRTVHTQGQWAYREDYHSGYTTEPGPPELRALPRSHSPLPLAPERGVGGWSEGPRSLPDSGRASPCLRDGEFFLRLLQTEVERMEGWCQNMEREAETNELPEEVLELIRGAVGSAQMLMSQRVQQFFRMCQQSVDPSSYPQPTTQDLASFWDLLQLAIEDVRVKFQDLQRLKDSGWRLPPEKKEDKKVPPPLPKKPIGGVTGSLRADSTAESGGMLVVSRGRSLPEREKSLDVGDRQKLETRRRLLQTKRSASFRQNSATESADSIEIYITEAQTRL